MLSATAQETLEISVADFFMESRGLSGEERVLMAVIERAIVDWFTADPDTSVWRSADLFMTDPMRIGCYAAPLGYNPLACVQAWNRMINDPVLRAKFVARLHGGHARLK